MNDEHDHEVSIIRDARVLSTREEDRKKISANTNKV